ncbi:hypothetical protein [Aequorivita sediminis]|uniref:hypothetical protein n=1 Tax=Aequorivita sediminis TaxID=3073653 RepID=UPI0028A95634|nr:hypothetical protein [Aequorivita sp. F6058]
MIILGDKNSILVSGEVRLLATPSAQQSRLKIQVNKTFEPEFLNSYPIFEKSILFQGDSAYYLKPVIRAILVAESGAIVERSFLQVI